MKPAPYSAKKPIWKWIARPVWFVRDGSGSEELCLINFFSTTGSWSL